MKPTTSKAVKPAEAISNPENTWFDGEKYIPVSEMSNDHLQRAKYYAQTKEESFYKKAFEFADKINMLEVEAERRGIILKDRDTKFQKSQAVLKNALK